MTTITVLDDGIGQVNFKLVKGVAASLLLTMSSLDPLEDITAYVFELNFYVGRSPVGIPILTSTDSGIVVDPAAMTAVLNFSAASVAARAMGQYNWDLRYTETVGADPKQLLRGEVDLEAL